MSFTIALPENILRSDQILADADALLAGVAGQGGTGASTATSALGALGALDVTDVGSGPTDAIASTLNQAILELHNVAEAYADLNGIPSIVHGLTNLGETIGLGHIGQAGNLVTDLLHATDAVGHPEALGPVLPDVIDTVAAATGLLQGAADDAGVNSSILGLLPDPASLTTAPVVNLLNGVVGNVHATLENFSDLTPFPGLVHGVTGLGNSIGLGNIGGANLLTDLLHVPVELTAGDLTSLTHLPGDVANVLNGVEGVVSGVLADLGNAGNLSNPVATLTGLVDGLAHGGAGGHLNPIVDNVHAALEVLSDSTPFPGLVHGVTGLGNAVGLGDLGGSNLATDLTNLPGALASGDLSPVTNLPSDVGSIVGAAGHLANGVGSDLANSPVLGTLEHPATGGGILGGNLPGQGIIGQVTGEAGSLLDGAHTGAGGLTGALGGLTGGLGDGGHGLLGTLASAVGGATGGGNLGALTGTLDGLTGGLNGGGSGSHDLATVTVGPQTPTSGLQIDVLSSGQGATHPVDVHVGTASAETPTVINLGVLTGGSFHFPAATGGGDALSGLASSLAATAHAPAAAAPAVDAAPAAHADLPPAAAHPLEALAHPIAHAA